MRNGENQPRHKFTKQTDSKGHATAESSESDCGSSTEFENDMAQAHLQSDDEEDLRPSNSKAKAKTKVRSAQVFRGGKQLLLSDLSSPILRDSLLHCIARTVSR